MKQQQQANLLAVARSEYRSKSTEMPANKHHSWLAKSHCEVQAALDAMVASTPQQRTEPTPPMTMTPPPLTVSDPPSPLLPSGPITICCTSPEDDGEEEDDEAAAGHGRFRLKTGAIVRRRACTPSAPSSWQRTISVGHVDRAKFSDGEAAFKGEYTIQGTLGE
jgi:hypothetical protein